jgi:hypothetical protein
MEVGQGPNWGCGAKGKKLRRIILAVVLKVNNNSF